MGRIRVTQIFPWLLPWRKKQRVFCFYLKMRLDGRRYAKTRSDKMLPYALFSSACPLYNTETGFDMVFQQNKAFNLKLVAARLEGVLIRPGETFSFWQLAKKADETIPYKSALIELDGRLQAMRGGGLCQLSNLIFWLFLHTPLTIVERRGHAKKAFPEPPSDAPLGVDATVYEGWLDLKVRNDTARVYQLTFSFDESQIVGCIRSDAPADAKICVHNENLVYRRKKGVVWEEVDVVQTCAQEGGVCPLSKTLYRNRCQIDYALPADAVVAEGKDKPSHA